eukprot:391415-Lingulodinium_polyedra.AAC.1
MRQHGTNNNAQRAACLCEPPRHCQARNAGPRVSAVQQIRGRKLIGPHGYGANVPFEIWDRRGAG